jgi:RNA-directed DNA polymerase
MGQAFAGQHHVLRLQPGGQPCGAENHAVNDPGLGIRHRTQMSLADIARQINPLLWGWIEYYGRYAPSALHPVLRYVNQTLLAWARRKFKRFAAHKIRASRFLQGIAKNNAELFVHWRIGMTGTFA